METVTRECLFPKDVSSWDLKRPGLECDSRLGTMESVVLGYMYGWSSNPSRPIALVAYVSLERNTLFVCVCMLVHVWFCVGVGACVCAHMCMGVQVSKRVSMCVDMCIEQELLLPVKSLGSGSAVLDPSFWHLAPQFSPSAGGRC